MALCVRVPAASRLYRGYCLFLCFVSRVVSITLLQGLYPSVSPACSCVRSDVAMMADRAACGYSISLIRNANCYKQGKKKGYHAALCYRAIDLLSHLPRKTRLPRQDRRPGQQPSSPSPSASA